MKIIIPMAGRGSRLRPHTLTIPKPLLPVAGKPIVQRIVEDFASSFPGQIEEVAFIIGDFGAEAEEKLKSIAEGIGAQGKIYYQDQPLGPAHAISCAKDSLEGNCLVAFADTLFKADFAFDPQSDGIIWAQKVEDPSSFGVIKHNAEGIITEFVEKSPVFVSDLAIVGIYYFRDGAYLCQQIDHLIENNIRDKGEFQITSVLENMKEAGTQFRAASIEEWLDCGNKDNVLATNQRILELKSESEHLIADDCKVENSQIIPPCYIGPGVQLQHAIVGPYCSIGANTSIKNSIIRSSIIQKDSQIESQIMENSMIGSQASLSGQAKNWSLGDYSQIVP